MNDTVKYIIEMTATVARIEEKVGKLESVIYTLMGFVTLQLLGLFILWAKDHLKKKP